MPDWINIGRIDDVPAGTGREFTVGDRILAVYNVGGKFYAMDGICPHAGGPLGAGSLDGCIVTCPWHGWQFDVSTGQHCLSAPIRQPTFPVRIVEDEIFVALP